MITRIDISGFKSIRQAQIELKPINLLIGGNGVGKSNFIAAFTFVRNLYEGRLQDFVIRKGGADSFLYFGRRNTSSMKLDFYFDSEGNENRFIVELGYTDDNSLFISSIDTAFLYDGLWRYRNYGKAIPETTFQFQKIAQAYYVNDRLREFEVFHFHDTGDTSPMKGICNINENQSLKKDGSNIAAFLYFLSLRYPQHFNRIEKTIQSIAPFFGRFNLLPDRLNEQQIRLAWFDSGAPDSYFNASHLSDGTLRFICLATLLLQPYPPKTIIIDEPELGLHPVAINKLAGLIQKISPEIQVIVSTQSVNLVDNFEPENIIVADRVDRTTVFKRLNQEDLGNWLEEYSLGEAWENNLFGGQPL